MKAPIKNLGIDKWQLLLGCILYLVVFILWISGMVERTTAFLAGISALLMVLSSYELRRGRSRKGK